MITLCLLVVAVTAIAIACYKHLRVFNYWKDRGVPYEKPIPFFGNSYATVTSSKYFGEILKIVYDKIDHPYFGFFLLDQPILIIKSPKLIKQILIKDFPSFRDRTIAPAQHSEILRNFLLLSRGNTWKYLRNQLSPLFTSGRLKGMTNAISEVGDRFVDQIGRSPGHLDAKEIYTNFITEAIAKCFFSIETKCLTDEKSIFREILRRLFHPSHKMLFVQLIYFIRAGWVDVFKLYFVDSVAINFLVKVFSEVIELRKTPNEKITDIVDVMIKHKNIGGEIFGKMGHFASGVQFMVAGIETTSTGMSWFVFELAMNQDIQDRLREEIRRVVKKHDGEITWDGLQEMKYLDMCYLESFRRYPFVPFLDRTTMEDYKVEETDFVIEKGTLIFIPLYALCLDEKYFPEPYRFIPERFADSPHAHANNDGLVYMPFGAGQRICLGERYAGIATKIVMIKTLLNYKIETCEQSPSHPVSFKARSAFLESKDGLSLKFTPLNIVI